MALSKEARALGGLRIHPLKEIQIDRSPSKVAKHYLSISATANTVSRLRRTCITRSLSRRIFACCCDHSITASGSCYELSLHIRVFRSSTQQAGVHRRYTQAIAQIKHRVDQEAIGGLKETSRLYYSYSCFRLLPRNQKRTER